MVFMEHNSTSATFSLSEPTVCRSFVSKASRRLSDSARSSSRSVARRSASRRSASACDETTDMGVGSARAEARNISKFCRTCSESSSEDLQRRMSSSCPTSRAHCSRSRSTRSSDTCAIMEASKASRCRVSCISSPAAAIGVIGLRGKRLSHGRLSWPLGPAATSGAAAAHAACAAAATVPHGGAGSQR